MDKKADASGVGSREIATLYTAEDNNARLKPWRMTVLFCLLIAADMKIEIRSMWCPCRAGSGVVKVGEVGMGCGWRRGGGVVEKGVGRETVVCGRFNGCDG